MNNIKGLSEKKKEEIIHMSLRELYQVGYDAGFTDGQAASLIVEDTAVETIKLKSVDELCKGDKVKFIGPNSDYHKDVTIGELYEINEIDNDGYAYFLDDKSDSSYINKNYCCVFEKVVESETFEHEGKLLRKVDREAREGNYAIFSKEQAERTTDVTPGKFYKIEILRDKLAFRHDGATKPSYILYGKFGRTPENVEVFEVVGNVGYIHHVSNDVLPEPTPLTANQQRAELIQRAREFVEGQKKDRYGNKVYLTNLDAIFNYWCNADFIVNRENGVVVCLLKHTKGGQVKSKGIAKCMPGDVFHADIGKAIALAKALEIDIPQEFLNAVQPDKKVVGMVVNYSNRIRKISTEENFIHNESCHLGSDTAKFGTIIDDTNAVYESGGA